MLHIISLTQRISALYPSHKLMILKIPLWMAFCTNQNNHLITKIFVICIFKGIIYVNNLPLQ